MKIPCIDCITLPMCKSIAFKREVRMKGQLIPQFGLLHQRCSIISNFMSDLLSESIANNQIDKYYSVVGLMTEYFQNSYQDSEQENNLNGTT